MSAARKKALRWERRPGERPQELLEAALRVFAARGYRNTRLEEVATAAGVTKGALYHYFANKEELLLRALEAYRARAFGRVEEALRAEGGPSSVRLRVAIRELFGNRDPARRDVLLLLQSVAHDAPAVYRDWLTSGPVRAWRIIADLIEDGKASGEFRVDVDTEVTARIAVTGLMVQLIWQQFADDVPPVGIDGHRLIDGTVELLLAGLAPAPTTRPRRGS
jgi:AcrR family transcriptional regulator